MGFPALLIPKLEGSYFDFDFSDRTKAFTEKVTVKALKTILKDNNLKRTGLKADLMQRVKENDLLSVSPGPRWFYFDEAFGQGEHTLHFICMCGQVQCMKNMRITKAGVVSPSIICGNNDCKFHIWGMLDAWNGKPTSNNVDYRAGSYRLFNATKDNRYSRLFNSRWRG